jgi:hypothetical protein
MLLGGLLGSIEVLIPGTIVGMLGMALPFVNLSNLRIELLAGALVGSLVFLLFAMTKMSCRTEICPPGSGVAQPSSGGRPPTASLINCFAGGPPWGAC